MKEWISLLEKNDMIYLNNKKETLYFLQFDGSKIWCEDDELGESWIPECNINWSKTGRDKIFKLWNGGKLKYTTKENKEVHDVVVAIGFNKSIKSESIDKILTEYMNSLQPGLSNILTVIDMNFEELDGNEYISKSGTKVRIKYCDRGIELYHNFNNDEEIRIGFIMFNEIKPFWLKQYGLQLEFKTSAKDIDTFPEFSKFLKDNNLMYVGDHRYPIAKLIIYKEFDIWFSIKEIEKQYNVKLNILKED